MSDKLRMGVIGCGGIGVLAHLPGIVDNSQLSLVAVSDAVEDKARSAASKFGALRHYTDYRKLLEDPEVDAVTVATPVFLHREMVVAAAQAGKHVLCEKPMARTAEECLDMIDAARKAKVQLSIMFQQRNVPMNAWIKDAIDGSAIGRVFAVSARSAHSGPDVRMSVPGSDMASWVFNKEMAGGGVMFDIGVHLLDLLRWLFGDVESVSAEVGTFVKKAKVEDNALLLLKFKSGIVGTVELSWSQVAGVNLRSFYGTEGTIVSGLSNDVRFWLKGASEWERREASGEPWWHWHRFVIKDFASAILEGRRTPITGEDGLATLRIIEAAYTSSNTGERVTIS